MKAEILQMLREADGYISGQQLCEHFHVSRTAIWKAIEQLKKEGYQIEAVRNCGYKLVDSPDVMTREELELALRRTKWIGKEVVYYDKIGSTNNQAKADGDRCLARGIDFHGKLFVADTQSAGKGRRGRGWSSPPGTSIAMTTLLRPDIYPDKAPMLTLVEAMSVAKAVRKVTGLEAKIKWPNDIVINGKKICGILTEMSLEMSQISHVVIGTGINVNQESFPEEIAATATSLRIETGQIIKREELIAQSRVEFEELYEKFLETEDLSLLQDEYNSMLVNIGREVRVLEPKGEFNGKALGIDELGQLLVETPVAGTGADSLQSADEPETGEGLKEEDLKEEGENQKKEIRKIFAGEVSVRGIYGYV